jgi:hypothetical protein
LPAWILLLLAGPLPAALLLTRLLVRGLALLAGMLFTRFLLAWILVHLTAHSGSPFLNVARTTTEEPRDRC